MASWQLTGLGLLLVVALTYAGRPCDVEDTTISKADGEKFILPIISGICIEYTCTDGSYGPTKIECVEQDTSNCHPLDTELTADCITKTCQQSDGGVRFAITSQKCKGDDGCYNPGEKFARTHNGVLWSKSSCAITEGTTFYSDSN